MQFTKQTSILLLTSSLFISAGAVSAQPRPLPQNNPVSALDRLLLDAVSISFNGARFFYRSGDYYKQDHGKYKKVSPPVGITVPNLPPSRTKKQINGEKYFIVQGSYYRRVPNGYMVVEKPVPVVIPKAPEVREPVTIWIDNSNGSRTPVEMVPVEGGQWRGPKGEYYAAMPTIDQLKPVYGLPEVQAEEAAEQEPAVETVWISNENGSKTPVELTQQEDDSWVGPNGEIYTSLPSEDDLRPAYGLQAD